MHEPGSLANYLVDCRDLLAQAVLVVVSTLWVDVVDRYCQYGVRAGKTNCTYVRVLW